MEFINLEKVDSTNLYAKKHIETLDDRTVILTKEQTAGRGRLNRSWIDLGKNNVFMSIVLKPSETYQEVYSNITQYLSVVLCHALEDYGLKPQIKWPNDVLVNGKKIAGILSESVIQGTKFKGLVLGIGINLNATDERVKSITDKEVTALNLELKKEVVFQSLISTMFSTPNSINSQKEMIENSVQYIKENYYNTITLQDLADKYDKSPQQFSYLFYKYMGIRPIDYIIQYRLKKSFEMLNDGYKVREVALSVGYDDPYYFSRLFKKHFNFSPSEVNKDTKLLLKKDI